VSSRAARLKSGGGASAQTAADAAGAARGARAPHPAGGHPPAAPPPPRRECGLTSGRRAARALCARLLETAGSGGAERAALGLQYWRGRCPGGWVGPMDGVLGSDGVPGMAAARQQQLLETRMARRGLRRRLLFEIRWIGGPSRHSRKTNPFSYITSIVGSCHCQQTGAAGPVFAAVFRPPRAAVFRRGPPPQRPRRGRKVCRGAR
jgi:hypothetical protein